MLAAMAAALTTLGLLAGCGGGSEESEQAAGTSRSSSSAPRSTTATSPSASSSSTPPPADGTAPPPASSTVPPPPTRPAPPPPAPPPPAPPAAVPAALRGQDVTAIPTSQKLVALTFDAGANSAGLPSILATLRAQRVSATFFLTGQWAAGNPAQVQSIRAAGHRIGNHSMNHPYFTRLSTAQIGEQLAGAQQAIQAAGADPRPLFRFPYGDRDPRTIAAVNDLGYLPVRWTVDTLGWKGTSGGMSVQAVSDRAVGALQPGAIVLMHIGSNPDDGTTLDADALPNLIDRMRGAGYSFVTLDSLLGH
jgi:peptidoglycan/xylan/chitin deacetylase (PgdA/CDA1 family)